MKHLFSKKLMQLSAVALTMTVGLSACSESETGLNSYNLSVDMVLPADGQVDASNISDLKLIVVNAKNHKDTLAAEIGKTMQLTLSQGSYQLLVSGKVKDEANAFITGKTEVSLYADTPSKINLEKVLRSSLIFKALYTTGGKIGYIKDSYFEIVNNSDEVQYLDGLILSAPDGNNTAPNAWQAAGMNDLYNCGQGVVVAFPGTGKEYPIQPGESVVVANDATNHQVNAPEGNKCPDLSKADWEIYIDNVKGEIDYPAPNLKVIFQNNRHMKAFGLGFYGRGYVLARLPQGMTPEEFAQSSDHVMTEPGTTGTMPYLMIPSKYVLDAVELYDGSSTEKYYNIFLPQDDAKGIATSPAWEGQSVRRKVERIENDRVYYKDTNNSEQDFLNKQPLTPGETPTQVDQ